MKRKALQIVRAGGNHAFELDEITLTEILLKDEIKDRYVCVVSVAGAFRKGKSFLLNFFLRYMCSRYVKKDEEGTDWLGDENEKLSGFSWRGGSERDTIGIVMWSDIFLYDLPNGDEIAIIFLDTQGTFDNESTMKDCATIFALSTMLSSVQIFNLSQNIQEDDLQHLELFTEYGRLALADIGETPFQRLQFLVRDWSCRKEWGSVGGRAILEKKLMITEKHPELQSVRRRINSCFKQIECFLMPHPGLNVSEGDNFNGELKDIRDEFKNSLRDLVPMLLAPENLILKEINGHKIRASDLLLYLRSYMKVFKGDKFPEPKSLLMATAEANNLIAEADAVKLYMKLMTELCGEEKPYLGSEELEANHKLMKEKAFSEFSSKRKMGGEELSKNYRERLENKLEEALETFKNLNTSKEKDILIAEAAAVELYTKLMTELCGEEKPYLGSEELEANHKLMKEKAFSEFSSKEKMCGEDLWKKYRERLENKLEEALETFKNLNTSKEKDILRAEAAAVELYTKLMTELCGEEKPYLGSEELEANHKLMKEKAFSEFSSKEKMCGEDLWKKYRERLENKLEEALETFKNLNTSKEKDILIAEAAAVELYTKLMTELCGEEKPYLGSEELEANHKLMKEKAFSEFSSKEKMCGEDLWKKYRERLENKLEEALETFKNLNTSKEKDILIAEAAAVELYTKLMTELCGEEKPYLGSEELEANHKLMKEKAFSEFSSKEKMCGEDLWKKYRERLENKLEEALETFKNLNTSKEKDILRAEAAAVELYTKLMTELCGEEKPYLGREELEVNHKLMKEKAFSEFSSKEKMCGEDIWKKYRERLENKLEEAFETFQNFNTSKEMDILIAEAAAVELYTKLTTELCGEEKPYLGSEELVANHKLMKEKASSEFSSKKKMCGEVLWKKYRERLENKLEEAFETFKNLNTSKEKDILIAEAAAVELYTKLMTELCGEEKPYIGNKEIEATHKQTKEKALSEFSSKRKIGGYKLSKEYLERVENKLDNAFITFKNANERKMLLCEITAAEEFYRHKMKRRVEEVLPAKFSMSSIASIILSRQSLIGMIFGDEDSIIAEVRTLHIEIKEEALSEFKSIKKLCGLELWDEYRERLENKLDNIFGTIVEELESKKEELMSMNIFKMIHFYLSQSTDNFKK